MATFRRFQAKTRYSGHLFSRPWFAAVYHCPKKAAGNIVGKEHTEQKRSVPTLKFIAQLMDSSKNNIPQTPTRDRDMQRELLRAQQSTLSPNYERRRTPPVLPPPPLPFPTTIPPQPAVGFDPFYVPPPVIIPETIPIPYELRMSQLRAQAAQLPPLQPLRQRGCPSRPIQQPEDVAAHIVPSVRQEQLPQPGKHINRCQL